MSAHHPRTDRVVLALIVSVVVAWGVCLTPGIAWAFREPDAQKGVPGLELNDVPGLPSEGETKVIELQESQSFSLESASHEKTDLEQALRSYLRQSVGRLGGIAPSQLRLDYLEVVPDPSGSAGMAYARFVQTAGGLDVEGSQITFSIKLSPNSTRVVALQGLVFPDLPTPIPVAFDIATAKEHVTQRLGVHGIAASLNALGEKMRFLEGQWRAVEEFNVQELGLRAVVDRATGETWLWDDKVYADVTGKAEGRGVLFDPFATGDNLNTLPMTDLKLSLADSTVGYTDALGNFTMAASTSPIGLSAQLLGQWSDINDKWVPAHDLTFSGSAVSGTPLNILFNPTGNVETDSSQVTAYYHTDLVHNWLHDRGILAAIDISTPTNVNLNSTCNAYYSGSTINFYHSGGGCINTAIDTVIYHEYGHLVDDRIGGIARYDGLSEGWGDTLSCYVSGQPLNGEGWRQSATSYVRTCDNSYLYKRGDEVHTSGQAWAGFNWHLRGKLIASLGQTPGVSLAESLVIPTFYANALDIPLAVREVALRDDNDADLTNGTPHFTEIQAAAVQHGLGWVFQTDTTPPTVQITPPPADGDTVAGSLTITAAATDNVNIAYVDFLQDGTLKLSDLAAPYNWSLNTCTVPNGLHTVTAKAYDWMRLTASHAITLNVQNSPGSVAITAPANGATVSGVVAVNATIAGCVSKVELYLDGALSAVDSTAPFSWSWDTSAAANGSHTLTAKAYFGSTTVTSALVTVTVSNAASVNGAIYDATLKAPACAAAAGNCDSGSLLLNGRDTMAGGPEANAPNAINNSCSDGVYGSYHFDESVDRLKISTLDGGVLSAGKAVKVEAKTWVYGISANALDVYYAADATAPTWTFLATVIPTATGAQTLSATYTLPSGNRQAVRAHFRYLGSASPCTAGTASYDESDDLVFAVGTPGPDTTPPSVSITAPANGAALNAPGITASGTAADDFGGSGLQQVNVRLNGGTWLTATGLSSWSQSLTLVEGANLLEAQALDNANNPSPLAAVTVNLDTIAPAASLEASPAGPEYTSAQTVTLTATATDNGGGSGISRVEFYDGASLKGTDTSSPYTFAWTLSVANNGTHTWSAKAVDAAGNSASSSGLALTVNITPDTTPPTVEIKSPLNGTSVPKKSTVSLTASASDNVGVTQVAFYVDGNLTCTATAPDPATQLYGCGWRTPGGGKPGKIYQLQAKASDAAGNVSTSTTVGVTLR